VSTTNGSLLGRFFRDGFQQVTHLFCRHLRRGRIS
jgi:hypothetical protein